MVRVSVVKFGEVPQSSIEHILKVISGCYEVIGEPRSEYIELYVFEKSEGEIFFATHDALGGKPRIGIYLDRLLSLSDLVGAAGVRRQAAHSVLHGSPEFYLIPFPESLLQAVKRYQLPLEYAYKLLQATGMAAKEYQVTDLLYEKGFVEDQAAYAKYILEPSGEEILAWEIASKNKLEKILHLSSILRDVSCALPLLQEPRLGTELQTCIGRKLTHLTPAYQVKLQEIISQTFSSLTHDLFQNISSITQAVIQELLDYELSSQSPEA